MKHIKRFAAFVMVFALLFSIPAAAQISIDDDIFIPNGIPIVQEKGIGSNKQTILTDVVLEDRCTLMGFDFDKLDAFVATYRPTVYSTTMALLKEKRDRKWSGSCFGLSATAYLDKIGALPMAEHFQKVNLNEIPNPITSEEVLSSINYYQLVQHISAAFGGLYYEKTGSLSDFKRCAQEIVQSAQQTVPFLFGYQYFSRSEAATVGHAIIATGIEKNADNSYDLLVYDNNYPLETKKIHISADYSSVTTIDGEATAIRFQANSSYLRLIDIWNQPVVANSLQPNPKANENKESSTNHVFIDLYDISYGIDMITVTNAMGDTLIVGPGDPCGGTMPIYDREILGDNPIYYVYEVPYSESFTIETNGIGLGASVSGSGWFLDAYSKTADTIEITSENNVTISGEGNLEYKLHGASDSVIGESIILRGNAVHTASLTFDNGTWTASGTLDGAVLSTFSGNHGYTITHFNIPAGNDPIILGGDPLNVTVTPLLALSASELTLKYKESDRLSAGESVTWSSNNPHISVDQNGVVTSDYSFFIKNHTALIRATSLDGERIASCKVSVKPTFWQWVITIVLFGWIWY